MGNRGQSLSHWNPAFYISLFRFHSRSDITLNPKNQVNNHQRIMNHETVNHDGTHQEVPNVIEQNIGLQSPTQRSQKQHAEINDEQGRSRPFKTILFESI